MLVWPGSIRCLVVELPGKVLIARVEDSNLPPPGLP